MVERIVVRFDGPGAGEGHLSWGQREIWDLIKHQGSWQPIGAVLPLPTGTTVDDAVADLRFAMSSYPSMRTLIRDGPDGPRQVVHGCGEAVLELIDAADDADPAATAEQAFQRYQQADYDPTRDWPVWMGVVRHRGVLTHRAWVMCHLVTDGSGANVILREVDRRDATGSSASLAPLDQADWQRSPSGQRQSRASLAHWEKVLRAKPLCQFQQRDEQPHPRYWRGSFECRATDLAIRAITARTGVETVSVLLGLYATVVARRTGVNPVIVQLVTNNRFRPRLAETVSPLIQAAPCLLQVPDATVDEAVARTRNRAIVAYKYAYYDPPQLDALIAQLSEERGAGVFPETGFNDRRLSPRPETGPAPSPDQIRGARAQTRFQWVEKQDEEPFSKLFVSVEDAEDRLRLTVTTDTHFLAPEEVEACVRELAELAVAAALDPSTRTGVAAAA